MRVLDFSYAQQSDFPPTNDAAIPRKTISAYAARRIMSLGQPAVRCSWLPENAERLIPVRRSRVLGKSSLGEDFGVLGINFMRPLLIFVSSLVAPRVTTRYRSFLAVPR